MLVVIAILDTVDYVLPDGKCIFRTCQAEKDQLVFQMVRIIYGSTVNLMHGYRYRHRLRNADCYLFFSPQGTSDPERALRTAKLVYVNGNQHDNG